MSGSLVVFMDATLARTTGAHVRQTGGPLSDDERAWADDVLGTRTRPAA
jgi:hypothetical protein